MQDDKANILSTDYDEVAQALEERLKMAFFGEPVDQMVTSIVLALAFYLATPIGTVVTIAFGLLFTGTFFVGLARFTWRLVDGEISDIELDPGNPIIIGIVVAGVALVGFSLVAPALTSVGTTIILAVIVGGVLYISLRWLYSRVAHGKSR